MPRLTYVILGAVFASHAAAANAAPDVVYTNARVLTINPMFDIAEAVAVEDGKIVAVGTAAEIARLSGPATRTIDLGGKTLMPGFYDNHIHMGGPLQPWRYGSMIDKLPDWLADADTLPKLLAAVKAKAAATPKGEWIVGEISREEWPNTSLPTRQDFDSVAPDHPVAIGRGPHTLLVNSAALKAAKVTRTTRPMGGEIVHDAKGEPSGKILESARRVIWDVMPPAAREGGRTPDAQLADWHKQLNQLASLGVTSVTVAGLRPDDFKTINTLYQRWGAELPRMTVQFRVYPGYDRYNDIELGVKNTLAEIDALGDRQGIFTHPKVKMGALKMSIDGGMSAPIFMSTRDYENRPGFRGEQRIPDSAFHRVARHAIDKGWQLGIHTMGDAAVVMVVDEMEKIQAGKPAPERRHYLHHVAVLPPLPTVQKMASLGINVASQPGFLLSLGAYADEALEHGREETQNPSRTLMNQGIKVSYGSDAGPYGPIAAIYAAVTRKHWNGKVHGIQEAVTVREALEMHTLAPAYFTFDETRQGSIEAGKVADLVVLSADPLGVDPERLQDIRIERTIIGGEQVFPMDVAP